MSGNAMVYLPRGIDPELLVSQVKNTMPYLFHPEIGETSLGTFPPAKILRQSAGGFAEPLSHFDYFKLCLSSHYLSCATPVPTDVDNQIRQKLWPKQLPLEIGLSMAQFVLDCRKWDFSHVSARFVYGASGSPWEKEAVDGHLGEWFTVAAGAYCALGQYPDSSAQEMRSQILDQIADEVNRHSEIFGSLWRANEGLECLKASSAISHNFGDLDRVMDMWDLSVADPLRLRFYKLGVTPFDSNRRLRYLGRLWVAGELYKSVIDGGSMAYENHRHFALRKPRALRKNVDLLIPIGPFFDSWGRKVAHHLKNSDGSPSADTYEVIEALRFGWGKLPNTLGYGRALRALCEIHPILQIEEVKVRTFRSVMETPQDVFERQWSEEALRLMDDIPSRA